MTEKRKLPFDPEEINEALNELNADSVEDLLAQLAHANIPKGLEGILKRAQGQFPEDSTEMRIIRAQISYVKHLHEHRQIGGRPVVARKKRK